MASEDDSQAPGGSLEKWAMPLPEKIPPATYAPIFLAAGITFLLFGVVGMFIFSWAGLVLIIWSVSKWVGELLHGE